MDRTINKNHIISLLADSKHACLNPHCGVWMVVSNTGAACQCLIKKWKICRADPSYCLPLLFKTHAIDWEQFRPNKGFKKKEKKKEKKEKADPLKCLAGDPQSILVLWNLAWQVKRSFSWWKVSTGVSRHICAPLSAELTEARLETPSAGGSRKRLI